MFQGHPWQMEGHMYFFVGLAALTLLCDWRPMAVAVVIIAAHHLLLGYVAPEWVFLGTGDLPRVMVHAIAVTLGAWGARPGDGAHGQIVRRSRPRRARESEESAKAAHRGAAPRPS